VYVHPRVSRQRIEINIKRISFEQPQPISCRKKRNTAASTVNQEDGASEVFIVNAFRPSDLKVIQATVSEPREKKMEESAEDLISFNFWNDDFDNLLG
jgi:hypothetical protein